MTYLGQIMGPSPWNQTEIATGGRPKQIMIDIFETAAFGVGRPDRFDGSDRSGGNFDIPAIFFP